MSRSLPCRRSWVRVPSAAFGFEASNSPLGGFDASANSAHALPTPTRESGSTSALSTLLCATLLVLITTLALAYTPPEIPESSDRFAPTASHPAMARTRIASPVWVRASLSHYGEGDGFMWQRTACGRIVTPNAVFVGALKPDLARCGLKITIRYKGRTIRTTVQDRGAWRTDDRAFDAAPGLRRRLHFTGVAPITYHKGWS